MRSARAQFFVAHDKVMFLFGKYASIVRREKNYARNVRLLCAKSVLGIGRDELKRETERVRGNETERQVEKRRGGPTKTLNLAAPRVQNRSKCGGGGRLFSCIQRFSRLYNRVHGHL